MKRSLERRLAAVEARRSGGGRAAVLLARFNAALALASEDELVKDIMIMQDDAGTENTIVGRIFNKAVLSTLTDRQWSWLKAHFKARQSGE